jgi:chromatin remodeling complex protein RSC6
MLELESVMGVVSIEHLFETESFRSPIKSHYLDATVSSESEVGQRVPDIELQEEYLMRSHLVIRHVTYLAPLSLPF